MEKRLYAIRDLYKRELKGKEIGNPGHAELVEGTRAALVLLIGRYATLQCPLPPRRTNARSVAGIAWMCVGAARVIDQDVATHAAPCVASQRSCLTRTPYFLYASEATPVSLPQNTSTVTP